MSTQAQSEPTHPKEEGETATAPGGSDPGRARVLLFAGICLSALFAALAYAWFDSSRLQSANEAHRSETSASSGELQALSVQPHVLFLQSDGDTYRRTAVTSLDAGGDVLLTDLECQRIAFNKDRGLCVGTGPFSGAAIVDSNFKALAEFSISGIASRARISPDGRYGSMTVFVQGHSYAEAGFSTRTAIVDMATGKFVMENLEELTVLRDGKKFEAIDFNFWGVTFQADSNRFYATLGSGGKTYLLEGNIQSREARVLRENVECPSLSPDGTRLVFKKRVSGGLLDVKWQLFVLDLATMTERPISEARNVDDQAEWLDNSHVLYYLRDEGPPATIRPDVWVASVDEDVAPSRMWERAFSPSVVR